MGIEPMTSPLPRECSTPELHRHIGAGEGNRTLVISLEGFCSTIELHPHMPATTFACTPLAQHSQPIRCIRYADRNELQHD